MLETAKLPFMRVHASLNQALWKLVSTWAVKGWEVGFKKERKRGQTLKACPLPKRLEAETATRPKIQPRLKHRGKDKPLALESWSLLQERDNACKEAYAQQDEGNVFEDYFQVQVAPCDGLMHGVQYLMLFHELQARADWESRLQAGWLRVVQTLKACVRHARQRKRHIVRAESGMLAPVRRATL